jgi:hypothetical protein
VVGHTVLADLHATPLGRRWLLLLLLLLLLLESAKHLRVLRLVLAQRRLAPPTNHHISVRFSVRWEVGDVGTWTVKREPHIPHSIDAVVGSARG